LLLVLMFKSAWVNRKIREVLGKWH